MDTIELMNGIVLECFPKELERQKPKSEGQKMVQLPKKCLFELDETKVFIDNAFFLAHI